ILEAQRDRDRLTFHVGTMKEALECRDLFPLSASGVCGLHWPSKVGLRSLRGVRQTLAASASPLEKGDALYLHDRPAEALDFYRQQVRISPGTAIGREARL